MKTIDKIPTSKIHRASSLLKTGAKVGVNYIKYYGEKIVSAEDKAKERLNKNNAEDKTSGCAGVAFVIGIICAVLSFFINYDAFWGIFFPA